MSIFSNIQTTFNNLFGSKTPDTAPRGFRVVDGKVVRDDSVITETPKVTETQKSTPVIEKQPTIIAETKPVVKTPSILESISKPISEFISYKPKEVQKPISTRPIESAITAFQPQIKPEEKGMLSTEKFREAYKEGGVLGDIKLIGKGIVSELDTIFNRTPVMKKTITPLLKVTDALDTGLGIAYDFKKEGVGISKTKDETWADYINRVPQMSDVVAGKIGSKMGLNEAQTLGLGVLLGVLTPGPGDLVKSQKTLDLLSKSNNADDVSKILSKESIVSEDKIQQASDLIAKTSDTGEIKKIILDNSPLAKIPKEQKVQVSKVTPESDIEKLSSKYKDEENIAKVIDETATDTGEKPNIVSRVFNSLDETKTKLTEYLQDEAIRVKKLQEKKGINVTDESDPYLLATLYPGRVSSKIEKTKSETQDIIDSMQKLASETDSNLDLIRKDVNDYLYYRHAPERNIALGEKASGITTEEAKRGLTALESSVTGERIKNIADRLQKINNDTLDTLKEGGVISKELYDTLRTKYENHIPLNRIFKETEDVGQVLSGRGFDVRSTGIKTAKGSEREVSDIMTNILLNHEQAVMRAEKNLVDNATLKFVRNNQEMLKGVMEEYHPKAKGTDFSGRVVMEQTNDPKILQLFENGKRVWIKVNDEDLAIALKGVGREKLPGILRPVAALTRLYSGLATRFNPEFFLPNKLRDLQETAIYLSSQKGMGLKGATKTIVRDIKSEKDVLDAIMGKKTEGARLYNEMKEMGGTTGGMGLSTRGQVELDIDKMERLAKSKTYKAGNRIIEYVDNWNTIFEDSTRLSVYKTALDQGMSKERAAFLAKEASINFNRMGKGSPIINALWMFSNASIQGSAKMVKSLKNPKVLGGVALLVGSSVSAVNEWNDKIDPEWRDKVSEWDRLNGLTVVLPSQDEDFRYFTIPVSWGLKPIKVMADYAYDAVSGEDVNSKRFGENIFSSFIDAYNPLGGTDVISALMPTAGDVPLEISRNKSWNGNKIRPDSDPNAPADIQYFQSLGETKIGQTAINISETLRDKAGIAVSPADIKYAVESYLSGTGRAVGKITNLVSSFTDKEPLPLDEYPLISRFYKQTTPEEMGTTKSAESLEIKSMLQNQSRERFGIKRKAIEIDKELSQLSPEEAGKRYSQIKSEDPALAEKVKEIASDRKLNLTYKEKLMKQLGVDNGERAEYIHKQIMKLNKEERATYYNNLKQKGIITGTVSKQLNDLVKKENRQ